MDKLSKEQRSKLMASVKGSNTDLERKLRLSLWSAGIKGYRVNYKIRGTPDIYFPKSKLAIFVDGCFWHRCPKCYTKPKTNVAYWEKKVEENVKRDREVNSYLRQSGYRVIRIWEHEIRNSKDSAVERIAAEL
jgi:DNA mismatch endonuclease (patch repair protein)